MSASLDEQAARVAGLLRAANGAKPKSKTLVFFGVKGGAGTTTIAVNCGVELARLSHRPTVIVDLKPGLGEATLFVGVRSHTCRPMRPGRISAGSSDWIGALVAPMK